MKRGIPINGTCFSCYSHVGRVPLAEGKYQSLSLGHGCGDHAVMVHEILHTIGLYHQHNSHDRDDFVKIFFNNVDKDFLTEFKKVIRNGIYFLAITELRKISS